MNDRFTFGVFVYNQEKEIIQTLNSIKFQVINYGSGIACNLIITDDCSKDSSKRIIDDWLSKNGDLFRKVIKIYNNENMGTVYNYHFILDHIDDEPFKIIAGDDLISFNNIFLTASSIGDHTFYNGFRLFFDDKKGVYYTEKFIHLQFWLNKSKMSRRQLIRLFKMGHIVSTPQTLYYKNLYVNANADELNSRFRLFEDNPTWYSIFKNVNDLDVIFDTKNLTLYRISDQSISNRKKPNPVFKEELNQLYKLYMDEGTIIEKLFFKSLINNTPKFLNFSKYVNNFVFAKCKLFCLIYKKEYEAFRSEIMTQFENGKKHYSNICKMSE